MLPTKDSFRYRDTHRLKVGQEKGIPCKWNQKKAGVAIIITDKIDIKINTVSKRQRRTLHNH